MIQNYKTIEVDGIGQPGMGAEYVQPTLYARWQDLYQQRYSHLDSRWQGYSLSITREVDELDLSFWQGSEVDFVAIKNAGIKGVYLRAGQNLWIDPEFENNRMKAEDAGLPWGSYYFFDSRVRPQDQADNWARALNGNYGQLHHVGDYEENYNGSFKGWVNFYHFMKAENDSYGGGFQHLTGLPTKRINIYTGYWYTQLVGKMPYDNPESLSWFADRSLWLAWYTNDPSIVKVPQPWADVFPSIIRWQYTSKGIVNGVPGNVDKNYWNGTLPQYNEYHNLGGVTPPPPTVPTLQVVYNPAEVNVELITK